MLYIKIVNDKAVRAATHDILKAELGKEWYRDPSWQYRGQWESFEQVERLAAELSEVTGKLYLATDAGASISPRYDVVEAPAVGDKVSYGFNGDCYPCGEIVRISQAPACRLITARNAEGREFKFYRRQMSGVWIYKGTWALVSGHVSKENPLF